MRYYLTSIALFLSFFIFSQSFFSFSQNTYEFDYIIEYKSIINDSIGRPIFYLTNSKDNQYRATIMSIDETTFSLSFYKHGRVICNGLTIQKADFYKAETIILEGNCYKPGAIGKILAKKFSFQNLKDTIIGEMIHKRYVFNHNSHNLKEVYAIKPQTEFHLPILSETKSFIEWKEERNIPNGIYNELYYLDLNGNMVEAHFKLVAFQKIKKYITVKY